MVKNVPLELWVQILPLLLLSSVVKARSPTFFGPQCPHLERGGDNKVLTSQDCGENSARREMSSAKCNACCVDDIDR